MNRHKCSAENHQESIPKHNICEFDFRSVSSLTVSYVIRNPHVVRSRNITAINQIFECSLIWLYICKCNQTVKIENMNCLLIAEIESSKGHVLIL